ncbi:MAG: hypothetical protein P5672_26495, partial [Limnospira sp. PMC 1234.20]|nr:hypothetical protein [Limnospira sp. PMC 1234.20]
RLPFPASIPESCILKLGVSIAFTLYSLISQFVFDLESPALLRFLQASGNINSYGIEAGNGRREVEPTTKSDHCQPSMTKEI